PGIRIFRATGVDQFRRVVYGGVVLADLAQQGHGTPGPDAKIQDGLIFHPGSDALHRNLLSGIGPALKLAVPLDGIACAPGLAIDLIHQVFCGFHSDVPVGEKFRAPTVHSVSRTRFPCQRSAAFRPASAWAPGQSSFLPSAFSGLALVFSAWCKSLASGST